MNSNSAQAYLAAANLSLVLEVRGKDAAKVVNNLSTNNIQKLPENQSLESFITDVRGWTVAHVIVCKQSDRVWLLGLHPEPARVASHIDRYIITEDAEVIDHSLEYAVAYSTDRELPNWTATTPVITLRLPESAVTPALVFGPRDVVRDLLSQRGAIMSDEDWQTLRVQRFWPLMGTDILDKCIPQEVDRIASAISFTKGCYLGQETIARLDARGQLQKKLCLLQFSGEVQPQASVEVAGKEIGQLTSVAWDHSKRTAYALAYLRRGFFEPNQPVVCRTVAGCVIHVAD